MTTEKTEVESTSNAPIRLAMAGKASSAFLTVPGSYGSADVWGVDKLRKFDKDEFRKIVDACRFFYRYDPIASNVINKFVDISITDFKIKENKLNNNETSIIKSMLEALHEFAEDIALEYLISGLVVPEVIYGPVQKEELNKNGIKRYESLILPKSLWLRDPKTIIAKESFVSKDPLYYVEIPREFARFLEEEDKKDDTSRSGIYQQIRAYYPSVLQSVREGKPIVRLKNPWILNRRRLTDSPYPTPYLFPVLESLRHKRNLRKMDYSVASRAIGAIQLFKLGNDEYPVTEDQQEKFDDLRAEVQSRNTTLIDIERIFQLFANHTLEIEWIYPPFEALLDDAKYKSINYDIMIGLGFPRILMTGETERTGTSDPEFATMSPISTMDKLRKRIEKVLNGIIQEVIGRNTLKGDTKIYFSPINLRAFDEFVTALSQLYQTGNLSRESYTEAFGYDLEEELNKRSEEKDKLAEMDLDEFAPQPFTPQPSPPGGDNNQNNNQNQ